MPIRHLLLTAFLLVGLLPVTLVTGLAFFEARSALITEIKHDTQTHATATVDEIDRILFERLHNTASWSQLEIMQDTRIGDVDKRLSKFLSDLKNSYHNIYNELYVLDKQGLVIASSDSSAIGKPRNNNTAWLTTKIQSNTLQLAPVANNQLLISTEIKDMFDGSKLGTLVAAFNWQQISSILESAVSGRRGAALFDSNHVIISKTKSWPDVQASDNIS
ncbi:MAG: cache domain-containing protein, partial [Methylotenera sp.]